MNQCVPEFEGTYQKDPSFLDPILHEGLYGSIVHERGYTAVLGHEQFLQKILSIFWYSLFSAPGGGGFYHRFGPAVQDFEKLKAPLYGGRKAASDKYDIHYHWQDLGWDSKKSFFAICNSYGSLFIPPQNVVLGGYTVFSLSVIPWFRHSEIIFYGFDL